MERGKYLFELMNNWRERRVEVYEHPTDPEMVVTYGYPFNGGDPVICEEKIVDGWERCMRGYKERGETKFVYN